MVKTMNVLIAGVTFPMSCVYPQTVQVNRMNKVLRQTRIPIGFYHLLDSLTYQASVFSSIKWGSEG